MQARAIDSSPVTDERGELLGTVSKNKMNREVGGLGHDPKTEPVEAHIEKNSAYCFEDQTIAEAEQIMLKAKVGEVPVVTHEKLLVGAINIEAIVSGETWRKASTGRIGEISAYGAAQQSGSLPTGLNRLAVLIARRSFGSDSRNCVGERPTIRLNVRLKFVMD